MSCLLYTSGKEIYLVCGATDMRKGVDGLAAIANLRFACVSFESAMFISVSYTHLDVYKRQIYDILAYQISRWDVMVCDKDAAIRNRRHRF